MKKIRTYILIHVTLILLVFHSTSVVQAQGYTNIPDINFENALWRYDDIPRDGRIPTAALREVEKIFLPQSDNNTVDSTRANSAYRQSLARYERDLEEYLALVFPGGEGPARDPVDLLEGRLLTPPVRPSYPTYLLSYLAIDEYDLTGIEDMVNLREVSYYEQDYFSNNHNLPYTSFSSEDLYALVEKYAAQIRHGKNETTFMSSADWFIENSTLEGVHVIRDKKITGFYLYYPLLTGVNDDNILTYQDEIYDPVLGKSFRNNITKTLLSPPRPPFQIVGRNLLSAGNKATAKAYVRIRDVGNVSTSSARRCIEIQYHYFFPYQKKANLDPSWGSAHDGDWEGYSVILNERGLPIAFVNTRHGDPAKVSPSDVNWTDGADSHPIMYTAMKTHAFYERAKRRKMFLQDRTDNDGYHFDTWKDGGKFEIVDIDPSIKTDLVPTQPHWLDFRGAWGKAGTNGRGVAGPTPAGNASFWNNYVYRYYRKFNNLPQLRLELKRHGVDVTYGFTISFSESTYKGESVTWILTREDGSFERISGEDESIDVPDKGYRGSLRISAQYSHTYDGKRFNAYGERLVIYGPPRAPL